MFCVLSQNFCVLSQRYLRSLAKLKKKKYLREKAKVLRGNANIFARERKTFEKYFFLTPWIFSTHSDIFPPQCPLKGSVQIQELHTKYKISCKMKRCIQNIINTSQKQTFANTFAIILIIFMQICVLHRELCVVFCKKCFMKWSYFMFYCFMSQRPSISVCFLQIWCVLLLFECQYYLNKALINRLINKALINK